jgi:hypothetical protein
MYEAAALVEVVNMLGLLALATYFVTSGTVDRDRLHRMVGILRGEEPVSDNQALEASTQSAKVQVGLAEPKAKSLAELQTDAEILRLEEERIKAELDQRLALNNSILLRVMAQREQFQREQEDVNRKQLAAKQARQTTGFQKQVDIYEALSPKVALDHLLGMANVDDAAKVLLDMDTRTAKKIIEAGKRGKDLEKMKRILSRLRDVAPAKSEELDGS